MTNRWEKYGIVRRERVLVLPEKIGETASIRVERVLVLPEKVRETKRSRKGRGK